MKTIMLLSAATLIAGAGLAFAFSNNPNGDGQGQANAIANCFDTIIKQNGNGQTGDATGSANDPKQLPTAVTNCDHFWQ